MKIVKTTKEVNGVKVKLSRKEKSVIKNIVSLLLLVAGLVSFVKVASSVIFCDPTVSLYGVIPALKYGLIGLGCIVASPILKHSVKF